MRNNKFDMQIMLNIPVDNLAKKWKIKDYNIFKENFEAYIRNLFEEEIEIDFMKILDNEEQGFFFEDKRNFIKFLKSCQ